MYFGGGGEETAILNRVGCRVDLTEKAVAQQRLKVLGESARWVSMRACRQKELPMQRS